MENQLLTGAIDSQFLKYKRLHKAIHKDHIDEEPLNRDELDQIVGVIDYLDSS